MSSPKYQLRLLAEVVVYKLYEAHLDDAARDRHSLDEVHKMFSVPVSKRLLESAINYMRRDRSPSLISRSGTVGSYLFKISNEGILFSEQQLKDKQSLMAYFAEHGDEHLGDVAGFDAFFHIRDEEQIIDAWKPINIDKGSSEYGDFIRQLDVCILAVRDSNELAAAFPDERGAILNLLEDGRELIEKDDVPLNKNLLQRYFVDPLRWLGAALGKGVLSAVANTTVQKLVDLLHTLL